MQHVFPAASAVWTLSRVAAPPQASAELQVHTWPSPRSAGLHGHGLWGNADRLTCEIPAQEISGMGEDSPNGIRKQKIAGILKGIQKVSPFWKLESGSRWTLQTCVPRGNEVAPLPVSEKRPGS